MKKIRPEVEEDIKLSGGLLTMIDNLTYLFYNITSYEFDYICEHATEDELKLFAGGIGSYEKPPTFSEVKKGLEIRNNYLKLNNESFT